MKHLDLSLSLFDGSIPSEIGKLTNLSFLNLGKNSFSPNTFPSAFSNLISLNTLSLFENELTGTIPSWISRLPLEHLYLW